MKISFQLILLLSILFATGSCLQAKEYRGIVPFHSTREDVTRLLGKQPDTEWFRARYELETETVNIVYSSRLDSFYASCVKQLPRDTVMIIEVSPKKDLQVSDLPIDKKQLRKFDSGDDERGVEAFIAEEEGLLIRISNGRIDQINYVAAQKDRQLCSTYYPEPENSIIVYPHGGHPIEKGENTPDDELRGQIYNFYTQLYSHPNYLFVMVNGGTDKQIAKRRAKLIKLIKELKYDMSRIRIFKWRDRGADETSTTFYLFPAEEVHEPEG